jgi:hypothetical protein
MLNQKKEMKKQAISLSVNDLNKLKTMLTLEKREQKLLGIKITDETKFQLNIVNYPTQHGKKIMYCSDTWKFESLDKKEDEQINNKQIDKIKWEE